MSRKEEESELTGKAGGLVGGTKSHLKVVIVSCEIRPHKHVFILQPHQGCLGDRVQTTHD